MNFSGLLLSVHVLAVRKEVEKVCNVVHLGFLRVHL